MLVRKRSFGTCSTITGECDRPTISITDRGRSPRIGDHGRPCPLGRATRRPRHATPDEEQLNPHHSSPPLGVGSIVNVPEDEQEMLDASESDRSC